jgi:hypothetical protein
MIRILLSLPVVLVLFAAGAMYGSYGQVDPCRALAVERARHAEHSIGLPVEGAVEPWTRARTSQMSTGACAGDLLRAWRNRLEQR